MTIAGKVALITGGVGGLGKAFATALLKARASAVCLLDISENGEDTASELSKKFYPSKVDFYRCDVTNYSMFKGAFDYMERKYGGLDILCNNAGIVARDSNVERSAKSIRINLEAVYYGTKLGMEYMDKTKGREGGVIVNIASMAAFIPVAGSMTYMGSKAGVVALTKVAALPEYYDKYGVRVNALCPTFAETPILKDLPDMKEAILKLQGHVIMTPEFVAEGFMQLVEDESLSGAVLTVTPQRGLEFHGRHKPKQSKL